MPALFWSRGRRLFSTAALLMILTATAHTLGFLAPATTPEEDSVMRSMDELRTPLGLGMSPSLREIFFDLAFTVSVMKLALGAISLAIAGSRDTTPALLRRVGWLNLAWVAAYFAVSLRYGVPPPLIASVAIGVVLILFLVRSRA